MQLLFTPYNKKGRDKNEQGEEVPKLQEEQEDYQSFSWDYPQERTFRVENLSNFIKEGRKEPLKYRDMTIRGLGIPPTDFTASGLA